MDEKTKRIFEDGRKIQKLERQLSVLHEEVLSGSGKNNPDQRGRLREITERTFRYYLAIAVQYEVDAEEIFRVEEIYRQAMGLPKEKNPYLVSVSDNDIPF